MAGIPAAFQLEVLFVHFRAQGDGMCPLPEYGAKGPAPSLYVTDSEAAFMKLVGGWVGAQIGRQHAQISVGKFFLSHAFGMQTLFSQRNSHKW